MIRELSLATLIRELETEDLLPAIVFRTSRSQCDADINNAGRNRALTVQKHIQQRLKAKVFDVIERYQMQEELITNHPHYLTLISSGIGAHHAGQLLVWRLLLEELMQNGLLRVLVATGTVAAGVDFPARTVVITAHSRRGSEGFSNFTAAEFQQMSGRAGRRGRDTVGFCVAAPSRFCDGRAVLEMAKKSAEPLVSAYFPSPSTVLNLLRYRNSDDLVYTVERSLAAYVDRKNAKRIRLEAEDLRQELSGDKHRDSDSQTIKRINKRIKRLEREAEEEEHKQVKLLELALTGLRSLGYIVNQELSAKGTWAANICTHLVLELSEIIESGLLTDASPERMVSIIGCLAGDSHRRYLSSSTATLSTADLEAMKGILEKVRSLGIPGVSSGTDIMEDGANTVLMWMHAESWQEFRGLLTLMGVQEGDVARLITQTAEHLNQLNRLSETFPELARKAEIARLRIMRPPLTEGLEISGD